MICTYDGCGKTAENKELGLCATHNRERRKPAKKTVKRPIKKVSDKMKSLLQLYNKLRVPWMKYKKCKVCKKKDAEDVHHMRGRTGPLLLDTTWWLPVCRECHRKITDDSMWAIQNGYSYHRNKKTI
jgi:hypothetical protein